MKNLLLNLVAMSFFVAQAIIPSAVAPRYFEDETGRGWIPIGCNICFVRTNLSPFAEMPLAERRAAFEEFLTKFAANGGNFARLWLGHEFFEVMPNAPEQFDATNTETLMRVVRLCEKLGIKLKLTLESFRTVHPASWKSNVQYANFFNRPLYSAFAKNMTEFHASERCRQIYLAKAKYLQSLGLGDSPAVICWELWNEINCTGSPAEFGPWSDYMIAELKKIFPRQMVVQNFGSYSAPDGFQLYATLANVKGNAFKQIHRYLDPGAELDVCRGPMDVLAAQSVRDLWNIGAPQPVVLAEVGAVKANHTGPSALYELDKNGTLLHDALFGAFFAGAAGCGQFWHWDHQYLNRWNLWWHFARFAKAVQGLDPVAENFKPFYTETRRLRVYGLRGKATTVVWCRDKASDWQSELVDSNPPQLITGEKLNFLPANASCYLPWDDKTLPMTNHTLPPFIRSIVVTYHK